MGLGAFFWREEVEGSDGGCKGLVASFDLTSALRVLKITPLNLAYERRRKLFT